MVATCKTPLIQYERRNHSPRSRRQWSPHGFGTSGALVDIGVMWRQLLKY